MKIKSLLLAMALVVLAGCATIVPPTQANLAIAGKQPTLAESKALLSQYFLLRLKDPDSVKELAIGQPELLKMPIANRAAVWRIPFVYNAKNSFGAYVGVRPWVLFVSNGQLDQQAQQAFDTLRGIAEDLRN